MEVSGLPATWRAVWPYIQMVAYLKQVDVVCAKPLEGLVHGLDDVLAAHSRTLATVSEVRQPVGSTGHLLNAAGSRGEIEGEAVALKARTFDASASTPPLGMKDFRKGKLATDNSRHSPTFLIMFFARGFTTGFRWYSKTVASTGMTAQRDTTRDNLKKMRGFHPPVNKWRPHWSFFIFQGYMAQALHTLHVGRPARSWQSVSPCWRR